MKSDGMVAWRGVSSEVDADRGRRAGAVQEGIKYI